MNYKMGSQWVLAAMYLFVAVFCTSAQAEDEKPQPNAAEQKPKQNAADIYRMAFAKLEALTEEDHILIRQYLDATVDDDLRVLAKKLNPAITDLIAASDTAYCDWGVPYEQNGFNALLPHLKLSRDLARSAVIYARVCITDQKFPEATTALQAVLTLADQIGLDDILICRLVDYSIQKVVVMTIASNLPAQAPESQRKLHAILQNRKALRPLKSVIEMERVAFSKWFFENTRKSPEKIRPTAIYLLSTSLMNEESGIIIIDQIKTDEEIVKQFQRLDELHQIIAKYIDKPRDEFNLEHNQLLEQGAMESPLVKSLLADFVPLRSLHDQVITQWLMLEAGIAWHAGGKAAFERVKDPTTGKPFKMTPNGEKSFLLEAAILQKSKEHPNGEQMTLQFGPEPEDSDASDDSE